MSSTGSGRNEVTRRAALAGGLGLAAAGIAAAAWIAAAPMLRRPQSAPTGRFVEVGGVRLHYRILGEGPPAVVIHGASGNLRDWTLGPAERLARGNRLILFDRPGLGFSDRAPRDGADPFVQARLLRAGARALGVERSHVIGHSYGGAVALAWALDAPESVAGLMAVAAPSQVWEGGVDPIYHLTGGPLGPVATRVLPAFVGQGRVAQAVAAVFEPQAAPPGYAERLGLDLALRPRTLRANGEDILALKGHIRRMVPRYPSLAMPVEILHGTADTIVPSEIHSEKLVAQVPGARLTRLPGIGHMPHHAATEALAAALERLNARL